MSNKDNATMQLFKQPAGTNNTPATDGFKKADAFLNIYAIHPSGDEALSKKIGRNGIALYEDNEFHAAIIEALDAGKALNIMYDLAIAGEHQSDDELAAFFSGTATTAGAQIEQIERAPRAGANNQEQAAAYLNIGLRNASGDVRGLGKSGIPLYASNHFHVMLINNLSQGYTVEIGYKLHKLNQESDNDFGGFFS